MDYTPNTDAQLSAMLQAIGVASFDELIATIPPKLRARGLQIPSGLVESEVLALTEGLAARNQAITQGACFLGAGAYHHRVPTALDALASRGEWLTPYTPYQAEASQGILQMIYEFQSMIAELFAMDISNASLYDGASAAAEAVLMAVRTTGRQRVILSEAVHPHTQQVIEAYLAGSEVSVQVIPSVNGITDLEALNQAVSETVAGVVMQQPNVFGCLEPMKQAGELAHKQGGLFISSVYPISLGLIQPPGSYGADIAVGEGRCLGTPLVFGGPALGLMTITEALLRRVPGRLVGETVDKHGKRCYTLTLQTREQHIRREKATSNICTNQGWIALRAAIYLTLLGPEGLRELAQYNFDHAHYLSERLTQLPGWRMAFDQAFFNEFAVAYPEDQAEVVQQRLRAANAVGGFDLRAWYPELGPLSLWCATEYTSKEQVDAVIAALGGK